MQQNRFDWDKITLAVFDVDGTLYRQRPLRLRMSWELVKVALSHLDVKTLRIIKTYRRLRENLGDEQRPYNEAQLLETVARALPCAPDEVRDTIGEWIHRRPLRHLPSCAHPGVPELFAALRRKKIRIGIVSDYPAKEKLRALGLEADYVVGAGETPLTYLKPHPLGLQMIIRMASIEPEKTVMIGDRVERDGEAARRAGIKALILSAKPIGEWTTFSGYRDNIFEQIL